MQPPSSRLEPKLERSKNLTNVTLLSLTPKSRTPLPRYHSPAGRPPLPRPATPTLAPIPAPVAARPLPRPPHPPRCSPPVMPLKEVLAGIPGADDQAVRSAAWRLAHHLKDVASVAFFVKCIQLVAMGGAPVARLLSAFAVADKAKEACRKPGALFCSIWNSWQPAPLPSSIRYYQNRTTPLDAPYPVQRRSNVTPAHS